MDHKGMITSQDKPYPFKTTNNTSTITNLKEESPRKIPLGGGSNSNNNNNNNNNSDRLKRDEWSEGAVSTLLEAYESKWVLRNRAKLKGHDWEDVARCVSSRANGTKSPKTQTQCKNKIESMKKRYRSESAAADSSSSWPLYPRLDLLLRGSSAVSQAPPPISPATAQLGQGHDHTSIDHQGQGQTQPPSLVMVNPPLMLMDPSPVAPPQMAAPALPALPLVGPSLAGVGTAQNSHGSNIGVDRMPKEDGTDTRISDHVSDKNAMDTDSSTPAVCTEKENFVKSGQKPRSTKTEKKKRKRREEWEIADSIRWLAEVVLRSEQSRMETMREVERMRIEAEAKRGEIDLKRTEILANTQLEIAKLFAGVGSNKGVDSALRIGRN